MKYFVRAVIKAESFQEVKKAKGYLRGRLGKAWGTDVSFTRIDDHKDSGEYHSITERGAQALFDMQKNWDTFK